MSRRSPTLVSEVYYKKNDKTWRRQRRAWLERHLRLYSNSATGRLSARSALGRCGRCLEAPSSAAAAQGRESSASRRGGGGARAQAAARPYRHSRRRCRRPCSRAYPSLYSEQRQRAATASSDSETQQASRAGKAGQSPTPCWRPISLTKRPRASTASIKEEHASRCGASRRTAKHRGALRAALCASNAGTGRPLVASPASHLTAPFAQNSNSATRCGTSPRNTPSTAGRLRAAAAAAGRLLGPSSQQPASQRCAAREAAAAAAPDGASAAAACQAKSGQGEATAAQVAAREGG
jgi:hypothetical protein